MNKIHRISVGTLICLFVGLSFSGIKTTMAQNRNTTEMALTVSIPAVALIDFEGSNHRIIFRSSNQVEQSINPSTANKTWLNYTSIVQYGSTNYITVHISSGQLPPESSVNLLIEEDAGAGAGKMGIASSAQIKLSIYPQSIITDIGSCFTGRGIDKGHQITYSWNNIDDYSESRYSKKEFEITVTYTITTTE